MRSRLTQAGMVLTVLALLGVALAGLLSGDSGGGTDRAHEIEQRLRCPECKSVSIAESQSDTARAMRKVVAEQLATGRTDQQIIDYFRGRYGDWVLLDPPASGKTLLLWLLPPSALAVGTTILFVLRRGARQPNTDLTPTQREHLERALQRTRARDDGEEAL